MLQDTRERFRPYCDPEEFDRIVEMDTVCEMWKKCAEDYSQLTAIEYDGEKYTYSKLDSDCADFRAVLTDAAPNGGRIGILAPNCYDFVKAFLAAATLGMTAVIFPPHLDKTAVFGCCMKYGIKALVYHPSLEESVSLAKEKLGTVPFVPIEAKAGRTAPMKECTGKTPCVMMFTGGTTGRSKCALLSHGAVMQGTVNGCYGIRHVFYQRYLLVLPFFHVFGLIRNLMTSLYSGSTLFICRSNKDMFKDIAVFRPTVMVMVPALAEMAMTLSKQFKRNMLGEDLKYIVCGAAAVPPYLIKEYDSMGISLLQGYGLTESANLVSGNPESLKKPDSIGIPYPNQELKIVGGELWLRGKNMMDGYIGEDEDMSFEDGWFRTGDLVRFDDEGMLYITGRIKEVIVLQSGENISPAELEAKFNTLPYIQDSQVFEDTDPRGRQILALEVVPRKTVLAQLNPENPEEFIISGLQEINSKLAPFERVSRITVRETDFERTPSMKIVRYKK